MPQRIEVPGMGVVEFPDGMNDDQISAAIRSNMAAAPSTTMDVAKSAGVGVAKGAMGLAGMIGDYSDLGAKGIQAATDYVSGKLGIEPYRPPMDRSQSVLNNIPTSASIQRGVEGVTGPLYKPQTTAGKYAQTVGEFLPSAALGPGGLGAKAATAVAGGLGSEAAGQWAEGSGYEPVARLAGAIAGGVAPAGLGRAITPAASSAERQRLVSILQDEGVTSLTAGQRTGNKSLQYAESILGDFPGAGQGTSRIQQEGQRQFTEAAMRRAGAGPNATPEVLAQNNARLGQQFEDLAARNTLKPDQQLATDLGQTLREYDRVLPAAQKEIVGNLATDIVEKFTAGGGVMAGADYQAARSRLSRMANNQRANDPDFAEALRGLRDTLDNGMRRSISPADREAWDVARAEYGAQKTIEKAASRAGEATAEGQLVPANLRNAVATGNNRGSYARGEGEFSELARAGSGVMAPLPNSGTAQRAGIQAIVSALGGGLGAGLASAPGAVAGAAAAGIAPAALGRVLMSRPAQAYLGNQVMARPLQNTTPANLAIARALLAQERPQSLEGPR